MRRNGFTCPTLVALLASSLLLHAADKRPNILYFYVDDMGWGAIGPNGQAERRAKGLPHVLTPNLDRLAAEGVNFTRSYGCTVCSPARSSQQTGFHQGHTFADRNDPNNAKKAIRREDLTMGDMLSEAGYTTGYWGKWGYGGSKSQEQPAIDNIQTLPTSHGYQHVVAELHHVRAHTFFQPTLWNAPAKPGAVGGLELRPNSMSSYKDGRNYPDTPALQNHPNYPSTAYCDDVYAFAALDFVRAGAREYNASGKPFFGLLAVQVPHAPFDEIQQLPEWDRAYRDKPFFKSLSRQSQQWAAMVTRIDAHFGNILAALEDPNGDGDKSDSVATNTLVIFQSDNGGPQHAARNEFAANGGLRASKGKIEEGGIRIPTLMRWPAKITATSRLRAGTSTDRIIDVTDLLPTFCELAGVDAPLGIDGVSLAPTLTGEGRQRRRDFVIHEAGNGQSIIRGRHKLIRRKRGFELYDLEADHAEEKDLSIERPELVAKLKALLLDERVDEPKGFANTYHHWTGARSEDMTSADNWSGYVYANAGITYTTDDGPPQASWVARMENRGDKGASGFPGKRGGSPKANARKTTAAFLALEIKGNPKSRAKQAVLVGNDQALIGRNEVRISELGSVHLKGGRLESQRWVEIKAGGLLYGHGTVEGAIYNSGAISAVHANHKEQRGFKIQGDFFGSSASTLTIDASSKSEHFEIAGTAYLDGHLKIVLNKGEKLAKGDVFTVLKAKNIRGRFRNEGNVAKTADGSAFTIKYTGTAVIVEAK